MTMLLEERNKDLSRRELGELFRSYRLAKNLSQEELSERTGLMQTTISAVEKGQRGSPETWIVLCEALEMDYAIPLRVMAGKDPAVEKYGPEITAWAEVLASVGPETRELIYHTLRVVMKNEPRKITDAEKERAIEQMQPLIKELREMSKKIAADQQEEAEKKDNHISK